LAQLTDLYSASNTLAPWIALLIGFGGSAHCVGMCGGLVLACAPNTKSNITYQLGRLSSYSLLGLFGGFLGTFLIIGKAPSYLSILPAIFIGALFVYWGIKTWRGKTATLKVPKVFNKLTKTIMGKALTNSAGQGSIFSSYLVGLVSILLPCGFLYSVVIAMAAFQDPMIGMMGMMGFWVGTVPAMSFAPGIIRKFLRPLALKMPKISSIVLICLGLFTIIQRSYSLYVYNSCH
jgi:sulfite exporter TauE/SafE